MENGAPTHSVGEYVFYRQNGICRINGIIKQSFALIGEKQYYELSPVYEPKTVVFVPLDSAELVSSMRRILSREEILTVIDELDSSELEWIDDQKARAEHYQSILDSEDRTLKLQLIRHLTAHRDELESKKKKLYAADARLLSSAEKAICEEFAFVLGIEKDEVIPYITKRIK